MSGKLSDSQSRQLGKIGQATLLAAAAEAKQFCNQNGFAENEYFHAALFSIIETISFLAIAGCYGTPIERRRIADQLAESLRKQLLHYHRDTNPKGPVQ